jgi:formiminotetrahydrofolate cyclodeaminase
MTDERDIALTTEGSTVEQWTARLAESVGDPGGGAASAVMLAMATALTSMVAGYAHDADDIRDRARSRRTRALELADEDARVSKQLGAALRRDDGGRDVAVSESSERGARSSIAIADLALDSIGDLELLAERLTPLLTADVAVAVAALRAALTGARTNLAADAAEVEAQDDATGRSAAIDRCDAGLERLAAIRPAAR